MSPAAWGIWRIAALRGIAVPAVLGIPIRIASVREGTAAKLHVVDDDANDGRTGLGEVAACVADRLEVGSVGAAEYHDAVDH